ncbi:hypothetical protein GCM10027059_21920 [Myceligenerans halotolerans]
MFPEAARTRTAPTVTGSSRTISCQESVDRVPAVAAGLADSLHLAGEQDAGGAREGGQVDGVGQFQDRVEADLGAFAVDPEVGEGPDDGRVGGVGRHAWFVDLQLEVAEPGVADVLADRHLLDGDVVAGVGVLGEEGPGLAVVGAVDVGALGAVGEGVAGEEAEGVGPDAVPDAEVQDHAGDALVAPGGLVVAVGEGDQGRGGQRGVDDPREVQRAVGQAGVEQREAVHGDAEVVEQGGELARVRVLDAVSCGVTCGGDVGPGGRGVRRRFLEPFEARVDGGRPVGGDGDGHRQGRVGLLMRGDDDEAVRPDVVGAGRPGERPVRGEARRRRRVLEGQRDGFAAGDRQRAGELLPGDHDDGQRCAVVEHRGRERAVGLGEDARDVHVGRPAGRTAGRAVGRPAGRAVERTTGRPAAGAQEHDVRADRGHGVHGLVDVEGDVPPLAPGVGEGDGGVGRGIRPGPGLEGRGGVGADPEP